MSECGVMPQRKKFLGSISSPALTDLDSSVCSAQSSPHSLVGSPKTWAPYSLFFANFARNSGLGLGASKQGRQGDEEALSSPINYSLKQEVDENCYKKMEIKGQGAFFQSQGGEEEEEEEDDDNAFNDDGEYVYIYLNNVL
jgi:hypothetical protein